MRVNHMKVAFWLAICIALSSCDHSTDSDYLYLIVEHDKYGFIDKRGNVVIPPIFLDADTFSEGLASARIRGRYGYIDKTGQFVIQPQFDYAVSFSEGLALVYIDGRPLFIDKTGHQAFEAGYPAMKPFKRGVSKVRTHSNKFGFINKQGQLIIDTVFSRIDEFIEGFAVVQGLHHKPKNWHTLEHSEVGIIDTLGRFLVPYGKYHDIHDCSEGYFKVAWPIESTGEKTAEGFVDTSGRLLFSRKIEGHSWIFGDVKCGLAEVTFYNARPNEDPDSWSSDQSYSGFINVRGDIVIKDTLFKVVGDFHDNRAVVHLPNRKTIIIDTHGNMVSKDTFSDVKSLGFEKGIAIVKVQDRYGVIDTNGRYVIPPRFAEIHWIGMLGNFFFFGEPDIFNDGKLLYGLAKTDGKIMMQPCIQDFYSEWNHGVLICSIEDKLTYINEAGKVIWQENNCETGEISKVNVSAIGREYYYAYYIPRKQDYAGDWMISDLIPMKIPSPNNFPQNTLSITVRFDLQGVLFEKYLGVAVFIANTSNTAYTFNVRDFQLDLKLQAKNAEGEWINIAYEPKGFCGFGDKKWSLPAQQSLQFLMPVYEGEIKTKLRIALSDFTTVSPEKDKPTVVYSNEFEGSVNPGQFWRRVNLFPSYLDAPYFK